MVLETEIPTKEGLGGEGVTLGLFDILCCARQLAAFHMFNVL